jgi:hypothetical protein
LGATAYGDDGRLIDWRSGLLPCLANLTDGDLLRLFDPTKLRHPESASAMALNSFLPWCQRPDELRLGGLGPFRELRYVARCPTGVRGTPPQLDLLAADSDRLVAVAARGPDYLGRTGSRLAPAYADVTLQASMSGWQALLDSLREEPGRFRHLDAVALLKNAIGLSRTFPERAPTLIYLFWEPEGADDLAFRRHRAEIRSMAQTVSGAMVAFAAMSFAELWSEWESRSAEAWLRDMVAELRARYAVAIETPTEL